ncbi:hypothetical protein V8017_19595 [Stenotrophomonas rhizophila]
MPEAAFRSSRSVPLPPMLSTTTLRVSLPAPLTERTTAAAEPVPVRLKSLAATLNTGSLKFTCQVTLVAVAAGVPSTAMLLTLGARSSTTARVNAFSVLAPPLSVLRTRTLWLPAARLAALVARSASPAMLNCALAVSPAPLTRV